jgi:hypothetical protein
MILWWAVFVCLSVRFFPLEQKGRTLRRPTWFHLVQPSPHIGCSAGIGTPDEVILPTTNTPRYSRFDPNRPDPNPIEDKVKEHIMAVSQQALASVPSRHHHVADCDVFKHSQTKQWRPESNQGPAANVYRQMLDQLSYSPARRHLLCLAKKMDLLCSICMLKLARAHVEGQSRNLLQGDSG